MLSYPLTVRVTKEPTDPLGLGVDAANGRVSTIATGSAFAIGAGTVVAAWLRNPLNNAVLGTVNGTTVPFGTARGMSILVDLTQGQSELEFVFTDGTGISSSTEVATIIRRAAATDPLGLEIDHRNGKVLAVDPGGAFAKSLSNPSDATTLMLEYKLVSVEGTRLLLKGDVTAQPAGQLPSLLEGQQGNEFMMVFDTVKHGDWAPSEGHQTRHQHTAPPPPQQEQAPTDQEALPLYERRPELYEPTVSGSLSNTPFTTTKGNATIIKDGGDNILQTRYNGDVIGIEEAVCDGVQVLVVIFADGSEHVIEIRGLPVQPVGCPMSYEALDQWEVDSCYGRFLRVKLEAFTIKKERMPGFNGTGPSTRDVWCCKICKMKKEEHVRDGSHPDRPEDAYIPRSHQSCGTTTGTFAKWANQPCPYPLFAESRDPQTGGSLCAVCKYPPHAHPEGRDPADVAFEMQGVSDLMWVMSNGRDGTKPIPGKESPNLQLYMLSQFGKTTASLVAEIERHNGLQQSAQVGVGDGVDAGGSIPSGFHPVNASTMLQANMCGWLEKYSIGKGLGLIKNWKQRYFTLFGGILQYHDSPYGLFPKGTIPLAQLLDTRLVTRCSPETHPQAKTERDLVLIFSEKGTERKLLMRAEDAHTHKCWCEELARCCSFVDCPEDHPRPAAH